MTPERIEKELQIRERYEKLKSTLTERARRLFVANEAIAYGYGGIAAAARYGLGAECDWPRDRARACH